MKEIRSINELCWCAKLTKPKKITKNLITNFFRNFSISIWKMWFSFIWWWWYGWWLLFNFHHSGWSLKMRKFSSFKFIFYGNFFLNSFFLMFLIVWWLILLVIDLFDVIINIIIIIFVLFCFVSMWKESFKDDDDEIQNHHRCCYIWKNVRRLNRFSILSVRFFRFFDSFSFDFIYLLAVLTCCFLFPSLKLQSKLNLLCNLFYTHTHMRKNNNKNERKNNQFWF